MSRRSPRHWGPLFTRFEKTSKKPPSKFDYLLTNGKVSQNDLDNALAEAKKGTTDIESLLIEKYKVPKAELGKSLANFHKCPYIEYNERTIVDIELLKNLNVDYLKKNHWMPLKRDRAAIEILDRRSRRSGSRRRTSNAPSPA